MALIPLDIPPGSGRLATKQASRGRWYDMSLVRFDDGQLVPIGGWSRLPGLVVNGPVRQILSWRDNNRDRWVAAASLGQIMVWDGANATVISPADFREGERGDITDGYGIGDYGKEPYGIRRQVEPERYRAGPSDTVALDNWGADLMAMGSADGRLLHWTPTLPVTAQMAPVANAPTGRTFAVTDQRHVMILGANGDPRRLSWCSQELYTDWAPTITNTAGSLQIRSTGNGLALRRVSGGILAWCDDDVHLANYTGPPYVYGVNRIGSGCGPIGPEAMVAFAGRAIWMGQQGFWTYDGAVRPLDCPISAYLFNDMSYPLRANTFGFHNGVFPELTWHYCSHNSETPDRYVTFNYANPGWTHGALERSIGCEPAAWGLPLLGDAAGQIWQHENGYLADGQPRGGLVFAETGDISIGEGDRAMFVQSIVPDMDGGELVQFRFRGQWAPGDVDEDFGVFTQTRADGLIDALFEARSVRFRIEGVRDGPWQLGRMRLEVVPGSGR